MARKRTKMRWNGMENIRTPVWSWDQNAVTLVADVIEQSIEAAAHAWCNDDMIGLDRNRWVEVAIEERSEGFENLWVTAKATGVGKFLKIELKLSTMLPEKIWLDLLQLSDSGQ
jgi:hypothetical protein